MDESVRLFATQQTLERDTQGAVSFFGQSVNETIRTCLINGMTKKADKVKSEFKVPDKRLVLRYVIHRFHLTPILKILVYQVIRTNDVKGFRGSGGLREVQAKSHWVSTFRSSSRIKRVQQRGRFLCWAL